MERIGYLVDGCSFVGFSGLINLPGVRCSMTLSHGIVNSSPTNHSIKESRGSSASSFYVDHSNGNSGSLLKGCRVLQVALAVQKHPRRRSFHSPELTPEDVV